MGGGAGVWPAPNDGVGFGAAVFESGAVMLDAGRLGEGVDGRVGGCGGKGGGAEGRGRRRGMGRGRGGAAPQGAEVLRRAGSMNPTYDAMTEERREGSCMREQMQLQPRNGGCTPSHHCLEKSRSVSVHAHTRMHLLQYLRHMLGGARGKATHARISLHQPTHRTTEAESRSARPESAASTSWPVLFSDASALIAAGNMADPGREC